MDVYNSTAADTIVNLNQTTVVATGDSAQPGIRAEVADAPAATGAIRIRVENSVLAGFEKSWRLEAPTGPARGDVAFTARYSVVGAGSFRSGDVLVDTSERVGFGDPGFDGINDFHLAPASPLIDAGDPAQALPDRDLDGNVRPLDGNGDGVAVRDVGAFEAPARIVPGPPSKGLKLGAVKFRYRTGRGGRLTFRISGNAQVRAVFTPVPRKGKATPKRRTVRIFRKVKAGRVKLKLGRHLLRRGKYQLKLTAASPDGSSGAALARTVRVR